MGRKRWVGSRKFSRWDRAKVKGGQAVAAGLRWSSCFGAVYAFAEDKMETDPRFMAISLLVTVCQDKG